MSTFDAQDVGEAAKHDVQKHVPPEENRADAVIYSQRASFCFKSTL